MIQLDCSCINSRFLEDPMPVNPLASKWAEKYPPQPKPEYSQVCDGYSCMWCGRCPSGEYWKCPDEDIEEYRQYQLELQEWMERHPKWIDHGYVVSWRNANDNS